MGCKFLLSTSNIRLKLLGKLQECFIRLFEVLKRVGPTAYKLDLSHSATLKIIQPIFNVILFRDFFNNGQRQQPYFYYLFTTIEIYGEYKYKMEAVVGHRTYRGQPQYYVKFLVVILLTTSGQHGSSYLIPKNCYQSIGLFMIYNEFYALIVSPSYSAFLERFTNIKSKCGCIAGMYSCIVLLLLLQHCSSQHVYFLLGPYISFLKTTSSKLKISAQTKGSKCQEASAGLGEYDPLFLLGEAVKRPHPKLYSCERLARL